MSQEQKSRRFTLLRSNVRDRFDSEPFAPRYQRYRELINESGLGETLGSLADVIKPAGRYRTIYVQDEEFGVKLLSGRQIAQMRPIGLKVMSRNAWVKPDEYLLQEGMVLLTADGRAEENLADCAMVGKDRVGWAASGHVHRLVARDGVHPGLLYLACASKPVQGLLKSMSTGSVVDALSPTDVRSVPVPYPRGEKAKALGDLAKESWDKFAKAAELENNAIGQLELELSQEKAS